MRPRVGRGRGKATSSKSARSRVSGRNLSGARRETHRALNRKTPNVTIPKSTNQKISNIAALKRRPLQQEALNILYEVANTVGPLMEHFRLSVGFLCEMFPTNPNLLGLNVNYGYKISLRLRPAYDERSFLPTEEIVETMIHELAHNSHGAHDVKFYERMDQLREKMFELRMKNVKFGGTGDQLGGRTGLNVHEARLKKLEPRIKGGVNRLGGVAKKGVPIEELIRQAAIKRYEDSKWCHETDPESFPKDEDLDIIEVKEGHFINSPGKHTDSVIELSASSDEDLAGGTERTNTEKTIGQLDVIDLTGD